MYKVTSICICWTEVAQYRYNTGIIQAQHRCNLGTIQVRYTYNTGSIKYNTGTTKDTGGYLVVYCLVDKCAYEMSLPAEAHLPL